MKKNLTSPILHHLFINRALKMEYRDKVIIVNENEFLIVPKGVEHKPVADAEVLVMLFEPVTTINTGNVKGELTKEKLEKI